MSGLTIFDWADLVADHKEQLRHQGWRINRHGSIRNEAGQCPLCALAELYGAPHTKVSFGFVARYIEPEDDLCGALAFIRAMDTYTDPLMPVEYLFVRDFIIRELGADLWKSE